MLDVSKFLGQLLSIATVRYFVAHEMTWQGFEALTALSGDGWELCSEDLCLVDLARVVGEWVPLVDQIELDHSKAICAVCVENV